MEDKLMGINVEDQMKIRLKIMEKLTTIGTYGIKCK